MQQGSLCTLRQPYPNKDKFPGETYPEFGQIYEVREVFTCLSGIGIRLVEIINPIKKYFDMGSPIFSEVCFFIEDFKEVQPPMKIKIEQLMNKEI